MLSYSRYSEKKSALKSFVQRSYHKKPSVSDITQKRTSFVTGCISIKKICKLRQYFLKLNSIFSRRLFGIKNLYPNCSLSMSRFSKKLSLIVVSDVTKYEWTIFGHFISVWMFTHFSPNPGLLFFKVCSFINDIKNLLYSLYNYRNQKQTSFFINRTPQIVTMHSFRISISIFPKKQICPVLPDFTHIYDLYILLFSAS